jgi:cyanate permease
MFPGVLLAVPGGLLVARIGDKWALTSGLAIMLGSAVLFAVSDSYGLMLFSRLLAGSGAVLVTILLPKVVTDWFAGKEIATAMATIASSFGLGVGLAMAILPFIAELTSWSGAVFANAATIVLAIVFLLTTFGNRETDSGEGKKLPGLWQVNRREFILSVLAGIGYGLFATGYVVFMAFLPTLLIAQGMHAIEAGLTTSLAAAVSLVSVPLGGVLSDKTGKPNHFIVGGALGTALTCFFVPYFAPTLLWILLFGFLRGGCTGGIMALTSQVLRPESRSNGFAVSSAVYFACMAAFPPVGGLLRAMPEFG